MKDIMKNYLLSLMKTHENLSLGECMHLSGVSALFIEEIMSELIEEGLVYFDDSYHLNVDARCTLTISLFRNSNRVHMFYRIYNIVDKINVERDIIKKYINIEDIYDIIDTALSQYESIQVIGISLPGIIEESRVISTGINELENINLYGLLNRRYTQRILVENDVNTAAVGFYRSSPQYKNLAILFQPAVSYAGIGLVYDGHLIKGKSNLAGEAQYLPLAFTKPPLSLLQSREGFEELLMKYIQSIMAMTNPEAIGICCYAVRSYDRIIDRLKKIFPKEKDLPLFIQLDDLKDYILIGLNAMCKEKEKD